MVIKTLLFIIFKILSESISRILKQIYSRLWQVIGFRNLAVSHKWPFLTANDQAE